MKQLRANFIYLLITVRLLDIAFGILQIPNAI